VWHISVLRNNLEPLHRFCVSNHIFQIDWSILLNPRGGKVPSVQGGRAVQTDTHHGTSYASASTTLEVIGIAAFPFPLVVEVVAAILERPVLHSEAMLRGIN
jgi:hypothetical protein